MKEPLFWFFVRNDLARSVKLERASDGEKLCKELTALQTAIRKHRDQRGDDRCWLDDQELYAALPEGYAPPKEDSSVELARCQAFIHSRHHPETQYVSPQRMIEKITAQRDILYAVVRKLARSYGPGGCLSRALHTAALKAMKQVEKP